MDISQFAHELGQVILGGIYDGMYNVCDTLFKYLFDAFDEQVVWAQKELTTPIDTWNTNAYYFIRYIVSKNICIPIAAAFITLIFCMELIHILQDSNQMNSIKPQNVIFIFVKFAVCAIICSKSFEIVMGLYKIGLDATKELGNQTITSTGALTGRLKLSDILPATPSEYTFGLVLSIVGDFFLILIAIGIVYVLSVVIYVRVMLWFLEFLIYAAAAPIPFSTFNNKEWSQVGMNYTRKMLALSFEGFFMLMMFLLYRYIVGGLSVTQGSAMSFVKTLMMLVGTGAALIMLMLKSGNISASIFNAH